jgi:hypothetical protein
LRIPSLVAASLLAVPLSGHGEYTQGAPPGTFTLAIVLSLAREGDHPEVPPQGARWLDDYLGRVNGRDGK